MKNWIKSKFGGRSDSSRSLSTMNQEELDIYNQQEDPYGANENKSRSNTMHDLEEFTMKYKTQSLPVDFAGRVLKLEM